jgi:hypothetical protein
MYSAAALAASAEALVAHHKKIVDTASTMVKAATTASPCFSKAFENQMAPQKKGPWSMRQFYGILGVAWLIAYLATGRKQ